MEKLCQRRGNFYDVYIGKLLVWLEQAFIENGWAASSKRNEIMKGNNVTYYDGSNCTVKSRNKTP